jgi:hypothetical protein
MATLEQMMSSAPLWAIGIPFFLGLLAASTIGTWLRRRPTLHPGGDEADGESDGYLLSAALALLGLLIAFTFSLAVSRYDARRAMVMEEGNAIGTTGLRATLAEGAEGAALREEIKTYVDIRLKLPSAQDPNAIEDQTAQAQTRVWQRMRAALPTMPAPLAATLVTATTEMFDAASRRKAERNARIPARVLDVVSLYALMSAGIVGYVLGRKGRRHIAVTAILFLLLTLAMILILDLDRPWSGSITISPQPIIDARAALK